VKVAVVLILNFVFGIPPPFRMLLYPVSVFVPHANWSVYITDDGMWPVQVLGACKMWGTFRWKVPGAELPSRVCWVHLQVSYCFIVYK